MALCRCCFISTVPAPASPTESPVLLCGECGLHYGNQEKTTAAHEVMMARYRDANASVLERLDERREALAEELERAQQQIVELTATITSGYRTAPAGDAKNAVETAIVAEAASREATAMKARDRAMRTVLRLDEMHHEDGIDCSCGRRITQCPEFAALGSIRNELQRWAAKQTA